ncbi:MAG: hypothetical protein Q8R13_03155 [bacterium]|nr:hypothetical protein [bacterium]MDZ4296116.1 hypothetical protein [Patescibacteria group bacterium]
MDKATVLPSQCRSNRGENARKTQGKSYCPRRAKEREEQKASGNIEQGMMKKVSVTMGIPERSSFAEMEEKIDIGEQRKDNAPDHQSGVKRHGKDFAREHCDDDAAADIKKHTDFCLFHLTPLYPMGHKKSSDSPQVRQNR